MSFETYRQIYNGYDNGTTLRSGRAAEFTFCAEKKEDARYRLFVVGQTKMFYLWKNEPDEPANYRTLVDCLDDENALNAQYCLNMSSKKDEQYVRRAYKKVMWPPVLAYLGMHPVPEDWTCGLWVKAENLKISEGGYARMRIEVREKQEGRSRHAVGFPADKTLIIDLAEGTYDWTKLTHDIVIDPDKTANVGVWVEGVNYSGKLYVEAPFLTASSGENLLPEFAQDTQDEEKFSWSAQYLSRKEWPEFRVKLNGETVFEDEIFERCHVDSEWSIDLPADLMKEENTLVIEHISDYHDPVPYIIHEVGFIEQPGGSIALISAAETGIAGGGANLLLRTEQENTCVRFTFPEGQFEGPQEVVLKEKGLHGVQLLCKGACEHAKFVVEACGKTIEGEIARIVEKSADDIVVTGTGDMIYVEQRMDYVEEYLSWYISNGVGNLLTIRPTYRWSGTRLINPEVWKVVTRVLNGLNIKYALMVDAREMPGIATNPDDDMLAGEKYLGRQNHERDGAMYYWGLHKFNTPSREQFNDMQIKAYDEDPLHVNPAYGEDNVFYADALVKPERSESIDDLRLNSGGNICRFRNPIMKHDMLVGEKESVAQLKLTSGGNPRHTGPSVMFKYLFKAGYKWQGAETMYGSMEPLMSFLRGASLWAGVKDMGVHHAVQWSSSPQDAPEHFRRYRLALYVSYMQGATEINTEEGLWHLEEYYSHFHRFSKGCEGHQIQQQDFYRYLATHSRTGEFYAPMAVLHGRADGWHAFGNHQPWGWIGVKNSDAEKSWDLLKVFYPLSKPGDALYIHGCDTDHPVGYHTGTPMGNVDALPVEADEKLLSKYKALAFMGYNYAEKADFDRLMNYVSGGGTLLMTRAHLTSTTCQDDIAAGQLDFAENPMSFSCGAPEFACSTVNGQCVRVCVNAVEPDEIIARTDDNKLLIARYNVGKGSVILFNVSAYPANPAIRPLYEEQLKKIMSGIVSQEAAWAECGDDVGSAMYDQADGTRHIYLLPVDWYRDPALIRKAYFRADGYKYEAAMPFGVMIKAVSDGKRVAWPHDENGEVICLTENGARVQGTGKVLFTLAQNGEKKEIEVDFAGASVQTVEF